MLLQKTKPVVHYIQDSNPVNLITNFQKNIHVVSDYKKRPYKKH